MTGSARAELGRELAEAALGRKAQDVVLLDVSGLTSFADAFVICTGTSDRHVRAVADAVTLRARELGHRPLGVEGEDEGNWVLIDLGDVIVHVFRRATRDEYDLERLWSEAPATLFGEREPREDEPGEQRRVQ